MAEPVIEPVAPTLTSFESVDLVRGVIMILMALDHRSVLRPLRAGALDVRVNKSQSVSHYTAAGMELLGADCLDDLGSGSPDAVSAMPVVCRVEKGPQRCLAQLFLST